MCPWTSIGTGHGSKGAVSKKVIKSRRSSSAIAAHNPSGIRETADGLTDFTPLRAKSRDAAAPSTTDNMPSLSR